MDKSTTLTTVILMNESISGFYFNFSLFLNNNSATADSSERRVSQLTRNVKQRRKHRDEDWIGCRGKDGWVESGAAGCC